MKRTVVAELLDSDSGTAREVADSLTDLLMFNRVFGGIRSMTVLLREVAARSGIKEMVWLDVAGGTGDVAALTREALEHVGITVHPVVMDRAPTHMNGGNLNVCGDALALPFRDNSIDVIGSSLFVHHLEPDELARFAAEAFRVARHAFVISDITRHPLLLALALAGRPIYRSRLTRHDAPASVRRAYTPEEIRHILQDAGAGEVSIRMFYLYRMGVIAWKTRRSHPTTT
jgi:ubiquinone/menaquinone biosynthesis C-methylase UbiE